MRKQDLIDFDRRSRVDLSEIDAAFWRERKRQLGIGEGNRIADELREHVLTVRPDWPSEKERLADFEAHVRLSKQLRSVGEITAR